MNWLNDTDLAFERAMRGRHKGRSALIVGRGPSVARDVGRALNALTHPRLIGVNHAAAHWLTDYAVWLDTAFPDFHLPHQTLVLQDTPVMRELAGPRKAFYFTSPPDMIPGWSKYQRRFPRPWGCIQYTSMTALWLAWYMGCDPIYCAGFDFAFEGDQVHGDREYTEINDEIRLFYEQVLPDNRRQFADLAAAIRADGVKVDWPAEKEAVHA